MSVKNGDVTCEGISTGSSQDCVSHEEAVDPTTEIDTGYRIVTEVIRQNKTTCYPFMEEVDVKGLGLWDYHTKVKTPMWIDKILEKFNSNEYRSITEIVKDFRTVVENCYRYNGTEHAISKKAKRLEMALESKLALLKKGLRDKTSISLTSEGRFNLDTNAVDENLVPISRYGRLANLREYASTIGDDSAKLVYDFVRCEETMLNEDEKKASYRERRQQEFLYQRIASSWINTVEENVDIKSIKSCSALPEVGLFLHICEAALKMPELNMYQFERSLIIPKHSFYLSKIMTSLLCSYQERSQISQRPPMQFPTWNKRLKERFAKWFDIVYKHKSYTIAAEKISTSIEFFKCMDWKNPFVSENKESFFELTFDQKIMTLKALCDALVPLQCVQNALFSMDALQLQCMQLGKDFLGNQYIYFPQFCGDEVRVYRHREFGEPVPIEVPEEIWTVPISPPVTSELQLVNGVDTNNPDRCMNDNNASTIAAQDEDDSAKVDTSLSSPEELNTEKKLGNSSSCAIQSCDATDQSSDCNQLSGEKVAQLDQNGKSVESGRNLATDKIIRDQTAGFTVCSVDNPEKSINSKQIKVESVDEVNLNVPEVSFRSRPQRVRKQTTRYTDSSSPVKRRSGRTGKIKNDPSQESGASTPTKKSKKTPRKKNSPKREPFLQYGTVEFELLCDSVDAIQLLINEMESEITKKDTKSYNREATDNHRSLISKLRWLYEELEPWNLKLQKARLSTQIRMKKEFDEISNSGKRIDPWAEELNGRNTFISGDHLTIYHNNSPISSIDSLDVDDEEYIHPYNTRRSTAEPEIEPVEKQYDESLYEIERQTLLHAALAELKEVLTSNNKTLFDIADRSELQESNPSNDRRTRNKVKQQNKLLGKILQLAEENCTNFPSLLPILVPNSDVFDTVDMVYLEEETRLQHVADDQLRKRQERQRKKRGAGSTIYLSDSDDLQDEWVPQKKTRLERRKNRSHVDNLVVSDKSTVDVDKLKNPENSAKTTKTISRISNYRHRRSPEDSLAIRLHDGRLLPATRLSDGRVIPIMRTEDTSVATSVDELIENTHREVERATASNVPTISLRPASNGKGVPVNSEASSSSSPNRELESTAAKQTTPVTVVLPRHIIVQPQIAINQSKPVVVQQPCMPSVSQIRPTPMKSIVLNGTRYNVVTPSPNVAASPVKSTSVQQSAVYFGQPTFVRPVLTPVQIINPSIKYQSTVKHNKPSNVVLVPVQNCTTAGIGPVRMGATPVMGVITTPQTHLQFQAKVQDKET